MSLIDANKHYRGGAAFGPYSDRQMHTGPVSLPGQCCLPPLVAIFLELALVDPRSIAEALALLNRLAVRLTLQEFSL